MKQFFLLLLFVLSSSLSFAQNSKQVIQQFLNQNHKEHHLTQSDVSNWIITDEYASRKNGITYVYIQQQHEGISVFNGVANFAIKNGKVHHMGNRLIKNLDKKAGYDTPSINPVEAIEAAAHQLNIKKPQGLKVLELFDSRSFLYNPAGISIENIPVELMYHAGKDGKVTLVWNLSIYTLDAQNWWSVRIDAQTGKLVDKNNWVLHCNFDHSPFTKCNHQKHTAPTKNNFTPGAFAPDQYNVFALPVESPNHGDRSLVTNPADATASPFGWHDTDGATGAEFTTTRGNNVFAYEDENDDNSPNNGFSPDGGPSLEFDFPFDQNAGPQAYQSAAITNLFYMNNMMHDIWYHYGFDEESGNFQLNNYDRGGSDGDYVLAEAQDGGGDNNANFATPPDGQNPRMQMYLWTGSGLANILDINSPEAISGSYPATGANFGPGLPSTPITADVVLMEDHTDPVNDGCEDLTNAEALDGKIALVDRGLCNFTVKVLSAQNAGALAVIVINNIDGDPITLGGTDNEINIPSIMIYKSDGDLIKAQLENGPVNATISNGGVTIDIQDGDFDNGIIAHEYGHGISNRLTGGGNNTGCLYNAEQMGEGWSDWFGLMLTIEPGDQAGDIRGVGTYAIDQPTDGNGIRPAPYSTDFEINPYTYGDSNNAGQISEPHGVGFIFATALWDLTWALIDEYGGTPDPDVYNGSGGNNIAMQLVIEGLKLQPCSPGMIDGRDAILEADQLLYDGAHQCLIWEVFANRGFGASADQGSAESRTDQTEAFDMPSVCLQAVEPPVAEFSPSSLNSCVATISFSDESYDITHEWLWNFGDGNSSTEQNPTHAFSGSGTYTVELIVTNNIGSDTTSQSIVIDLPAAPEAEDVYVCQGELATIEANASGVAQWKDANGNVYHIGPTLDVSIANTPQSFYLENLIGPASANVGPVDASYGGGGYHVSSYHGALNFTAEQSFEIVSAWIDADGAGPRTLTLANGFNNDGAAPSNIVAQVTVDLVDGPQRVYLNMMVPDAGNYNIGGNNVNLYRNNVETDYPFVLNDYMTILNSSASTAPTGYYYYFYDIEVRGPQCVSGLDTVTVTPVTSEFSYVNDGAGMVTFTDESNGATSWFWDFGDGNTSTEQSPVHIYEIPDNYTVSLTINDGCTYSETLSGIVSVNDPQVSGIDIVLVPNPTSGIANIVLEKALDEDLLIQTTDISGKVLNSLQLKKGQTHLTLDLVDLPSAVYFVKVKGETITLVKKLVKE